MEKVGDGSHTQLSVIKTPDALSQVSSPTHSPAAGLQHTPTRLCTVLGPGTRSDFHFSNLLGKNLLHWLGMGKKIIEFRCANISEKSDGVGFM